MFIFENKAVYLNSKIFVSYVYKILNRFPASEKYDLVDQLKRASVSIILNISEGFTRGSKKNLFIFSG